MPARPRPAAAPIADRVAASHRGDRPFAIEMLRVGGQLLRVGRQAGRRSGGGGVPLLLFNGIGGNIELLGPIAAWMPGREVITFDIPGVGHSPLPARPYRMKGVAGLAAGVLDHYGHAQADVLGVSWGGAAAQQFARSQAARCRRLILCATATGLLMVPARPSVLWKMATPRRYLSRRYAQSISGDLYGGDFRRDPALAERHFKPIQWQSRLGYYLQIAAGTGWTSLHWLHRLQQPTLVMAGSDDPLIPLVNARLLQRLIPRSELRVFDCGHLFLLTRPQPCAQAINEFLDRP
ncbi:MAG: poly(3-hydroxyalkanoate) depolymerase [Burkholderiales bacterium]|nr:poly(3-hydroxyalkanoate) depolymerase [Burkholderiales bacterium]MDE1927589.1 poly(3-hydroxyalkanoate) depolymerase [Burkholderiales bacterium]MDE2158618.1 poly(3-hydroxyalkanoate) depolymerase [Burkholderiales bacterium]MDE2505180.1 poly(3-hydroxyalkanoate) depolymerase [Burkholderiales bacterium]